MLTRRSLYSLRLRKLLTRRWSLRRDVVIAFGGAAICTGFRIGLMPFVGFDHTFISFVPAVVVAGAVAGARAALIALVISALIVWWVFVPPPFTFEARNRVDISSLFAFLVAAGLSGAFAAYLRATLIRLWESEERQRLLAEELNHRVKNTLATALALATLTFPKTEETKEHLTRYADRLNAIGRASTLLIGGGWASTDLRALLDLELGSFGENVSIHGPPLTIDRQAATNLAMIVHELATNSMKYGALSQQGRVEVAWRALDGTGTPRASLTWTETGGRPAAAPAPSTGGGFGSKLIGRLAEKELGGSAELTFLPDGLRAEIQFQPSSPSATSSR